MKYRTTLHRQIRTGKRNRRNGFKRIADIGFSNYFWELVERYSKLGIWIDNEITTN